MIGHNTQPVPPQLANYSHGNVMNDIDDIQLHHHTELLYTRAANHCSGDVLIFQVDIKASIPTCGHILFLHDNLLL